MHEHLPRLGLPLIQQGQAQKHVTHNEALELLDILVQLTVEAFDAVEPPTDPEDGQVWALASVPTGAWSDRGGNLAAWANGGWLFIAPKAGWRAARGGELRVWTGSAWTGSGVPAQITAEGLGIGASQDAENRLAVSSPAVLMTHAGNDHRLKINKASAADTATVLFQSDWAGRAEIGLRGTDDLHVALSADGASFTDRLVLRQDGRVGINTRNPVAPLELNLAEGRAPHPTLAGAEDLVVSRQGAPASFAGIVAGAGSSDRTVVKGARARGTVEAPERVMPGDVVLSLVGEAHDGVTCRGTAAIEMVVDGATGEGQVPQRIAFLTGPATGRTEQLRIHADGRIRANGAGLWVGPVQQTGLSAIIERGANPNGEYVRFADGTQICWHHQTASAVANTTWTFPAVFLSAPNLQITPIGEGLFSRTARMLVATSTSTTYNIVNPANARTEDGARLLAVGRWY